MSARNLNFTHAADELCLTQGADFGRILYNFALLITLLLGINVFRFFRLQFFVSSWAFSFPLSAMVIASFVIHDQTKQPAYLWIAVALLSLLSILIAFERDHRDRCVQLLLKSTLIKWVKAREISSSSSRR